MDFYGSVADFIAYCQRSGYEIGNPSPSPSDEIEAALVRGSRYIDGTYRDRFPGKKTGGRDQRLAWPRTDATDAECDEIPDDEVPVEIVEATYEAAWREFTDPGSLTPDYVASERVKSEQVGPLATTYAISDTASYPDNQPVISTIDGILDGLLGPQRSMLFGETVRF